MDYKPEQIMSAVVELKMAVEAGDKAREAKIEGFLEKQEEQNAIVAKKYAEKQNFAQETKEKLEMLEAAITRIPSQKNDAYSDAKVELKHMENFFKKKDYVQELKSQNLELKYLRTDNNQDGGYLVPIEYDREMIKKITEVSNLRALARVKTIGSNRISAPVRSDIGSAYWVGEGATATRSHSTYGQEVIPVHKLVYVPTITIEELEDSAWDMVSEITQDVGEAFAKQEGASFLTGTGNKQPEGVLTNANISVVNSGKAAAFDFNLLNDLQGELKTGYNASYGMNRKTISYIRKLTDANGQPLWQAGNLQAGVPNMILGSAYYEMPDLPDVAAGTKPVIFGDFRRGYTIVDRLGMRVLRDDFTLAEQGKVKFVFTKRVGGQVVLPEAIKIGKVAV